MNELNLRGRFDIQLVENNKLVSSLSVNNGITTAGKNAILDGAFRNQTTYANWYIGLITNTGFVAVAASDTMSLHAGWTEYTSYDESARPAWSMNAAATGSLTPSAAGVFNPNGNADLIGVFVASDNSKGGTAGLLWSTATFAVQSVTVDTEFRVNYTLDT